MPRGYAGKYLEVDLTKEKTNDTAIDERTLEDYFGGRGLGAKILWDRIGDRWAKVDPLGPENILLALTGPMTGIYPGGRICVTGKSPVSNGTVGSTASTEFAHELRTAGYDGVIVTGKASGPVYILVTEEGGEIRDAGHLWGTIGEDTLKMLNKEVSEELTGRKPNVGLWKEPGMIYVGPAGENMVRNAGVMTKLCHACGYGGYGSVMGSKNLKAIVAKGRGPLPDVWAPEAVKLLWKKAHEELIARDSFRRQGTGYGGWSTGATLSSEPVRNWQEEWHDERTFGGPMFENRFWVKKYWTDFNCTCNCMKLSCIPSGKWAGDITDNPDYELQSYLGTNFGIFDPADNIHLSALVDNLGHHAIGAGNAAAFAAELYQRGILTEEDLGFKLEWGDTEAFDRLLWMMARREGIGDVLAEGTYRAAKKIGEMKGVDCMPYVVHVKGIEVGAHGTRSDHDFLAHDISYAVNVQGGDHTSVASDGFRELSGAVFSDSGVICSFARTPQNIIFGLAKAITGYPITIDSWRRVTGPRIVTLQKALLLLGGPDVTWTPIEDDDNPPRFYEPLPSGPWKGRTTDRELVERKRLTYFETLGWDERGIPKAETLQRLGLEDLEPSMKGLRV
ncbi:aldehyde ferredoxin oxidoreductase [Candidatus Bathyarchaeota archaeon]|nr:aldehyde ferredoxin oxidoreductase [Candidatus Bathyarchaeota archaeon]MBL7167049.1 aldehyde ferredoxin oxidoreductase [Candidatus Bathyarchaeota archaeon]